MNLLTYIILIFSILGGIDRILNNRFGLGKEFEKGFMLFGSMALSMIGMIIIAPLIAEWGKPFFNMVSNILHIDPSVIPASLFANDMGGASLASQISGDKLLGTYNGLVVASMMGCTISFTIPVALSMVSQEQHKEVLQGILCGIITIPLGCFVSGLICKINIVTLLLNLLPLAVFSGLIAFGLIRFPETCVKIFSIFGYIIKIIITIGLVLGIVRFLTGYQVFEGLETIEEGTRICMNAAIVMTGAFPLMHVISKILSKPLKKISGYMGINQVSAVGFISSLATSMTTFGLMDKMDKKGVMLNSAFAVSAAFTFAGHLAFTMAFDGSFVLPVIAGKLISGFAALIVAVFIWRKLNAEKV